MEATAAGLTTGSLGAFTVVHGAASQIALTHSGSNASGDNHTLTATIQDAAGNTVTSDSSTVVSFTKTGGTGTVTGLANATASNGVATRVVVNAASGQIDLDAQAAGLATGNTSYVITAGSASTLTSTMTASPTSIVADGGATSTITVRLKDAVGNDLTGSGGTVALARTGTGSLSAVTDNGDGTYTATLTAPTTVGGATVTGTLNGSALAATTGVTYVHGPATKIVLTESGSTVAGNGHTLTATIQDAHGNTVTSDSSTVVAFAKTGGPGTVTGLGSATASNGVATKTVTNKLAGQIDLDAQVAGLTTGTGSYTIVTGPVSGAASDSTVVAVPAAVYANGTDTATITVTLRDAGGNGIAGKTVTLAQGGGGSAITGGGTTNASGVVTFSASDSTVETVTYTATDTTDSITLADDATVDFTFSDSTPPTNTITLGTANRALLTGTTLYYNGAAGGSFTLSSAVADGGAGPSSAVYPGVAQAGWAHGAETVSTPAGGPYVSSAFTFGAGTSGDFTYDVTANDAWTPTNSSLTTLNVTEDSTAPAASILCNAAACAGGWYTASPVTVTLAAPDGGAGLDQIRYTTDGTDPTIFTGNVYVGAFTVAAEGVTTVKYRAFDRIGNDSGVLSPDRPDRHDRARHDARRHAGRRDAGHDADLRLQLAGAGDDVPGAPERRLVDVGGEPADARPARREHLHVRRPRDRRRRERRREPGLVHLHGRHDVREHDDHLLPARRLELHERELLVHRVGRRPWLRVPPRRRRLRRLLEPGVVHRPHRGGSHVRGARRGRRRQPRRDAGDARLDGRPDRPEHVLPLDAGTSELGLDADLRPRLDRVPRDLRVRPRRRRLDALRDAVHDARRSPTAPTR